MATLKGSCEGIAAIGKGADVRFLILTETVLQLEELLLVSLYVLLRLR